MLDTPIFSDPTDGTTALTLHGPAGEKCIDLYSPEGFAAVSALYTKLSVRYRLMYDCTWLGVPIVQLPSDVLVVQELIWRVKPDVVVECGVAHGGSLILSASILELLGHGRVIGVDVDIRKHNRVAIEKHPLAKRITLVEGSSIDPATIARVKELVADAPCVMVLLDSNHTTEHVLAELHAYSGLVAPGSYLVAGDGAQALVSDVPGGKPEWRDSSPLHAIQKFLAQTDEFAIDQSCTRFGITSNTSGYLRRREDH